MVQTLSHCGGAILHAVNMEFPHRNVKCSCNTNTITVLQLMCSSIPAEVYQAYPDIFVPKLTEVMQHFLCRGGGCRMHEAHP